MSTICDLKDKVYKSLGSDLQYCEIVLKFLFTLNVPNVSPCLCDIDRDVIFIDTLLNPPLYMSPLYVDRAKRVVVLFATC